ncbi:hypothetical protein VSDG_08454 [Cytospora chrysosperma]|uniref:Uncharacterized protein n=1 Tax=Cytospora chrysosperma TaxID=252740 RepID=A0A423VHD0_CYTCH|nr:hypothetical protein VSDG_08454 [Valsa sordida]
MSPTAVVLSHHLLPIEAVDLGRLVLDVREPSHDFYQAKALDRNILVQQLESFSDVLRHMKGSRLQGSLTAALSTRFKTEKHTSALIESSRCITRQLENSTDYFQELCRLAPARAWLERAAKKNLDVFLVVGIKTLTDAAITHREGRLCNRSVGVQVPVMAAASVATAALGAILPLSDSVDPSISKCRIQSLETETGFNALGEQVYAVQYRKVQFSMFTRQKVDRSWLRSGNRWKLYIGSRGTMGVVTDGWLEANLSDVDKEQIADVDENICVVLKANGENVL